MYFYQCRHMNISNIIQLNCVPFPFFIQKCFYSGISEVINVFQDLTTLSCTHKTSVQRFLHAISSIPFLTPKFLIHPNPFYLPLLLINKSCFMHVRRMVKEKSLVAVGRGVEKEGIYFFFYV